MELKVFKEKESKKKAIYIGIGSIILLLAAIFVYRTYSIYQEKQEFDVIKGNVPDQNYDAMFSFTIEDDNGNKTKSNTIPEGKDYEVTVECTNGANGSWDTETWGPIITNLTVTRTKCFINFAPLKVPEEESLDVIKSIPTVTKGNGLYEVPHTDADITYTNDTTIINNLKQTELRFGGQDPDNYVTFNEEVAGWRMIGLVNTPEGQRIKLVRDTSIGQYAWDSQNDTVTGNLTYGTNEWSEAKLRFLMNEKVANSKYSSHYYDRGSGRCYCNSYCDCDFTSTGLTERAKTMIDTITWNTGASKGSLSEISGKDWYNYERSNTTGKTCRNGDECSDKVTRTTSWKGQVSLIYPSDYGYATSGEGSVDREFCLDQPINSWTSSPFQACRNNNWIYKENINQWTLTPYDNTTSAHQVIYLTNRGSLFYTRADGGELNNKGDVYPSLYLKLDVKVAGGDGTKENPYKLTY